MKNMEKRGGKRKNAGRKKMPIIEKAYCISIWITPRFVNYEKKEKVKKYLLDCLEEKNPFFFRPKF